VGILRNLFKEPAPSRFTPLDSAEALQAAMEVSNQAPIVLLKHSKACAASLWQRREVEQFAESSTATVFEVVVQQSKAISDEISSMLDVVHQTPQVIVVSKGRAVYDRSHGRIDASDLAAAVEETGSTTS
jgi:bacillithiol system protein YtxJ